MFLVCKTTVFTLLGIFFYTCSFKDHRTLTLKWQAGCSSQEQQRILMEKILSVADPQLSEGFLVG